MIAIEDEGGIQWERMDWAAALRLSNGRSPSISAAEVSIWPRKELGPGMDWTSDFHMQAQVFTEKVSFKSLFWKGKFVVYSIFERLLSSSQSGQS